MAGVWPGVDSNATLPSPNRSLSPSSSCSLRLALKATLGSLQTPTRLLNDQGGVGKVVDIPAVIGMNVRDRA